jgi:hypothetical protein
MERILLLILILLPFIFCIKIPEIILQIRIAETINSPTCSLKTCFGSNCTNYTCNQDSCIEVVPIGSPCS